MNKFYEFKTDWSAIVRKKGETELHVGCLIKDNVFNSIRLLEVTVCVFLQALQLCIWYGVTWQAGQFVIGQTPAC